MDTISALLLAAADGDRDSFARLCHELVRGDFIVPDRAQPGRSIKAARLDEGVEYPSPLAYLLGISIEDLPHVPFFSAEGVLQEWCAEPLATRVMSGKRLLETIPEGWWAVLNPGSDVEKSWSPWEIERLRSGDPLAIEELVAELFDAPPEEAFEASAVGEEEIPGLFVAIREFCAKEPLVEGAWVLRDEQQDRANPALREVVCVIRADSPTPELRSRAESLLKSHLIGVGALRILVVPNNSGHIFYQLLDSFPAVYERIQPGEDTDSE